MCLGYGPNDGKEIANFMTLECEEKSTIYSSNTYKIPQESFSKFCVSNKEMHRHLEYIQKVMQISRRIFHRRVTFS